METMLPKITDYWDEQVKAIEHMSQAVIELAPDDRAAALGQIRANVAEHVSVLDDKWLLNAGLAAADDLYKAACWINRWHEGIADYLNASSATLGRLFAERGFTLQYLVDNVFSAFERPLELFPFWYQAAGLVYVSPQAIARDLMRRDAGHDAPFEELLPSYNREARDVTAGLIDRCHNERRSFVMIDADYEEASFRSPLALAGKPGILTIFRNQAAEPDTTVSAWFPA